MTVRPTPAGSPLRLLVVGTTGGAGRALVRLGTQLGHSMTAFGRDRGRLAETFADIRPAPAAVAGSLADPATLERALEQQNAVLVALGPRRGDDPHAITAALRALVAAMPAHGVRRLLVVSGAGIHVATDRKPLVDRAISALVRRLSPADVEAKEAQLALLRATDLEWTVVRPPRLVHGAAGDGARMPRPLVADAHTIRGGRMVDYASLAAWMLEETVARRWVREAVFVASAR